MSIFEVQQQVPKDKNKRDWHTKFGIPESYGFAAFLTVQISNYYLFKESLIRILPGNPQKLQLRAQNYVRPFFAYIFEFLCEILIS